MVEPGIGRAGSQSQAAWSPGLVLSILGLLKEGKTGSLWGGSDGAGDR